MERIPLNNSALGIRKVYISQIIFALAELLTALSVFFPRKEKMLALLGFGSVLVMLAGVICELGGLKKASGEENGYQIAYELCRGMLLAVSVILTANLFFPKLRIDNADDLLYRVLNVFICYFVTDTTARQLRAGGHEREVREGRNALIALAVTCFAQVMLPLLGFWLQKSSSAFNAVSGLVNASRLFATLWYLEFLGLSWPLL